MLRTQTECDLDSSSFGCYTVDLLYESGIHFMALFSHQLTTA